MGGKFHSFCNIAMILSIKNVPAPPGPWLMIDRCYFSRLIRTIYHYDVPLQNQCWEKRYWNLMKTPFCNFSRFLKFDLRFPSIAQNQLPLHSLY